MSTENSIVSVQDLSLEIGGKSILKNISFTIAPHQILGIVGESGSGKSMTSYAIMGLLPKQSKITSGTIHFQGGSVIEYTEKKWRKIRGNEIGMIFQEPMTSLNPSLRCGFQVEEVLKEHTKLSKKERKERVLELFNQVKLPEPERIFNAYPHNLSGGQKQRIVIAMAIANKPKLLIADEPTTALDVTVQKEILALLKDLQQEVGMSIIFISHDLGVIAQVCDEVLVMKEGKLIEKSDIETIFNHAKHSYTKGLINSKPRLNERLKILPTVKDFLEDGFIPQRETNEEREAHINHLTAQKPLLEVVNLNTFFYQKIGWIYKEIKEIKAVNQINFKVYPNETLGLVGESGCGKTTLSRTILGLQKATSGQVFYKGKDLLTLSKSEWIEVRKEIQIIFQDPYSSLNPRLKVIDTLLEPMQVHGILKNKKERIQKIKELIVKVGLTEEQLNRYPHEFSGGQRQRIGIARALVLNPKLIICDESVSALDVSVQAMVLNLLNQLKKEYGFTYIFISHDLSVVKYMSDHLMVMNKGVLEEFGESDSVYKNPKSSYTQKLIDAIPKL